MMKPTPFLKVGPRLRTTALPASPVSLSFLCSRASHVKSAPKAMAAVCRRSPTLFPMSKPSSPPLNKLHLSPFSAKLIFWRCAAILWYLAQFGRSGAPHWRLFYLTPDRQRIVWSSKKFFTGSGESMVGT